MPISRPWASNSGPPELPGIDRGVGLQAVGVFQQRAGRILVAVHAGDDAVADGGMKIGGQQKRIADGEAPIADLHAVAVGHFGGGKIVAAQAA